MIVKSTMFVLRDFDTLFCFHLVADTSLTLPGVTSQCSRCYEQFMIHESSRRNFIYSEAPTINYALYVSID